MNFARRLLHSKDTLKAELLSTPVRNLALTLKGGILERCIERALMETRHFGIAFEPFFYLSDSYGCVEGTTNIGLGFWDADPLLRELVRENKDIFRDEGDLLLLLKHEIGHALCYGFKLYRLKEFRETFNVEGHFFNTYPLDNRYRPDPWSKNFVNPDGDHYAQKHPDDDFAETFATYIDIEESWKERYKRRTGVFKKIQFVRRVIRHYGQKAPLIADGVKPLHVPVDEIKETSAEFFKISPRRYIAAADGYMDPELKNLFRMPGRIQKPMEDAWKLVHRYRMFVEKLATGQTRIKDPDAVRELISKAYSRVRALGLVYLKEEEEKTLAAFSGLILIKALSFKIFRTFQLPLR